MLKKMTHEDNSILFKTNGGIFKTLMDIKILMDICAG